MKRRNKTGLPPGTIVFTGNRKVNEVFIHSVSYDADEIETASFTNQSEHLIRPVSKDKVDWLDVRGLHDTNLLHQMGSSFNIHPIVMESIADVSQRSKFDEMDNGIFIIAKALNWVDGKIRTEQVSIFFTSSYVLTFQEDETDLFHSIRERLDKNMGRIRKVGTDYLVFALLDLLVDQYHNTMEQLGDRINDIEDQIEENPKPSAKTAIHQLKRNLLLVRKTVMALREAIHRFSRSENIQIKPDSKPYIMDLYNHVIQVMDMVDNFRDLSNGLHDLLLSEMSFKMNQIMQVLTIITVIFIPLGFLAGIYGMNFDHMPELHHPDGYQRLIKIMLGIFIAQIIYFKYKKWI